MQIAQDGTKLRRKRHQLEPIGVSPVEAGGLLGASRSTIYRLLSAGHLIARKRGSATLVMLDSIRRFQDGLPIASFGADRPDRVARAAKGSKVVGGFATLPAQQQRALRRAVGHVTRLGQRAQCEFLLEIVACRDVPSLLGLLPRWEALTTEAIAAAGGRDFPLHPLHEVPPGSP